MPEPTSAPELPYRPQDPRAYRAAIGLIGCGGITRDHLKAYKSAGYNVAALCDLNLEQARKRQAEFFPEAAVYANHVDLLSRDDIEVVDIATHPPVRPPLIEAALRAGKHVLSQKPFVLDLDVGQRLVDLADRVGRQLAVNQNGRWAPHFSYAREAINAGLLGDVTGVHLSVHWDHGWVKGTPFEQIEQLILYDYAIHWFDITLSVLAGKPVRRVYASTTRTAGQAIAPPLLGQALIELDGAQASLAFDADTKFGSQDRTYIAGSLGSFNSVGPGNKVQAATLSTAAGVFHPQLAGSWFPDGFHGTMGELLRAIEEGRPASINAADNLNSLALCFAAVASARLHEPVVPGTVRKLPADRNHQ